MKDLTIESFLEILNTITDKTNIPETYLSVLGTFKELKGGHNKALDRSIDSVAILDLSERISSIKDIYSYKILGSPMTIEFKLQPEPLVYKRGDSAKFVFYASAVIINRDLDIIDSRSFIINREFHYTWPIDSVIQYSLYGYYAEIHGKMKEIHKYINSYIPENEVAQ